MPFQSKAQEKYLFAKHPDVAEKFLKDAGEPKNLPMHVRGPQRAANPAKSAWADMKTSKDSNQEGY
jgi:hypothetical protein